MVEAGVADCEGGMEKGSRGVGVGVMETDRQTFVAAERKSRENMSTLIFHPSGLH